MKFLFYQDSSVLGADGNLSSKLVPFLTLLCFISLGAIRYTHYQQPAPDDIRNLVANQRSLATIRGTIVTTPYIKNNKNWKFARFTHSDPSTSFYLKLEKIESTNGWTDINCILKNGVHVYIEVKRTDEAIRPSQEAFMEQLRERGIICFVARSLDDVEKNFKAFGI